MHYTFVSKEYIYTHRLHRKVPYPEIALELSNGRTVEQVTTYSKMPIMYHMGVIAASLMAKFGSYLPNLENCER